MMRGRRLPRYAAILIAAAGILMAAVPQANAATGADGFTILHAKSDDSVHVCNVFGDDGTYQAVVCTDIYTAVLGSDYVARGASELLCQTDSGHTILPCHYIGQANSLQTGDGNSTGQYTAECSVSSMPVCPNGRLVTSTRDWEYSISAAGGGTCYSHPTSAYAVWGLVWGSQTEIELPDGVWYGLSSSGHANDGSNEFTGHFYICP